MGHAAYARGSAAIAAQIEQASKATKKPDHITLLEAGIRREKARADKAEAALKQLESTLSAARRSVVSLRGSLQCEREERAAEVDDLKFRLKFAANALRKRRLEAEAAKLNQ